MKILQLTFTGGPEIQEKICQAFFGWELTPEQIITANCASRNARSEPSPLLNGPQVTGYYVWLDHSFLFLPSYIVPVALLCMVYSKFKMEGCSLFSVARDCNSWWILVFACFLSEEKPPPQHWAQPCFSFMHWDLIFFNCSKLGCERLTRMPMDKREKQGMA